MTITPKNLTCPAGLAAVAAGLLFILIQFIHPPENATSVSTDEWVAVSVLTATMAVLATIGVSAMYLRNVRRMGVIGLFGYVLFASCFVAITAWSFVEVVVLPSVAEQAPQFVNDFLVVPGGGQIVGDVGAAKVASSVTAVGYLLGGLLFGIALYRARVVARGAAFPLAGGSLITVLVPVLPPAFKRLLALPMGVALVALGGPVWRRERAVASLPDIGTCRAQLAPIGTS